MLTFPTASRVPRKIPLSARKIGFKVGQTLVGQNFKYVLQRQINADERRLSSLWLARMYAGSSQQVPAVV